MRRDDSTAWMPFSDDPDLAGLDKARLKDDVADEDEETEDEGGKSTVEDMIAAMGFPAEKKATAVQRFFARLFDNSIIWLLFFGFYILQLMLADTIGFETPEKDVAVLSVLVVTSMLASLIIHFSILTLFKVSMGKVLFGIRVRLYDGSKPMNLWFHIARETRVLVWGSALYVPPISLISMLRAAAPVAKGRDTRYDNGRAYVADIETHVIRTFFGVWLTLALAITAMIAIGLLGTLIPHEPVMGQ